MSEDLEPLAPNPNPNSEPAGSWLATVAVLAPPVSLALMLGGFLLGFDGLLGILTEHERGAVDGAMLEMANAARLGYLGLVVALAGFVLNLRAVMARRSVKHALAGLFCLCLLSPIVYVAVQIPGSLEAFVGLGWGLLTSF